MVTVSPDTPRVSFSGKRGGKTMQKMPMQMAKKMKVHMPKSDGRRCTQYGQLQDSGKSKGKY